MCDKQLYTASDAQLKWSQDEEVPAIKDVIAKLAEIQSLWIEAQKEYLGVYINTSEVVTKKSNPNNDLYPIKTVTTTIMSYDDEA